MTSINDWFFQKEPEDFNMNWIVALAWVVARLKEPSTYAGLMGLAATYHIPHYEQIVPQLITIFMAAASIAAILLPEKK